MFSNLPLAALLLPLPLLLVAVQATEYVNPPQSSPFEHRLAKRMDLEVCIGHFDVHKNTIIRTGESQAIGGKYLQGLELDTIEECERLCCETDACDVYIFERKAGGYCYLFECGPPENFHCKFTRHANYTSAVLTPQPQAAPADVASTPRPQLPHIPSNNISQQEWELSNLKLKPEARDKPAVSTAAAATAAATASAPTSGVAQPAVAPVQSASINHCGRFQFTCHSGECIAVYNACDGIPQCEDGSDEGPECITVSSPVTKPTSSNLDPVKPMVQQYLPVPPIQQQLQVPAQQLQSQPQTQPQLLSPQQPQQQHVIVLGPPPPPPPPPPMVNNREDAAAWANRKIIADGQQPLPQQQPQQQVHLPQPQGEIMNADEQSHIFSHKGGLQLQQATSGLAQGQVQVQGHSAQLQLPGYDNNQALAAGPLYGMSLPRSGMYLSPPQQQQLPQQASPVQQQRAVWPQVQAQPAPMAPQKQSHVYGSAPRVPAQQQAMLPVLNAAPTHGKNQGPAADEDYDDYEEEKSTEAPKKKQRKHKKVKSKTPKDPIELALEQTQQQQQEVPALPVPASPVHEQYKMIHENLALEFRDHDGHSERPGGAVLSLTFGLLVTAALAILIGCRMRTVGRRARRLGGKTPYSQEADFLVNGMYL
ncbi:low-density lipoprotein receptor-related protein 11 [Drosophila miranda]|uniref:low-density lipoprotein receptor-related protein 11 n=1 Tax=Drosophila miranda TaxID=7229 RepID=UPI00143F6296|nr:low-density lipoprotein receptor-related protein 11 [Drosophila miranda]